MNDDKLKARDDIFVTNKDASIELSPMEILGNDSRNDGNEISIVSITQPSNGMTSLATGGSITYEPLNGFVGIDTFEYTIKGNGGSTDTAVITIEINQLPIAGPDNFVWNGYF